MRSGTVALVVVLAVASVAVVAAIQPVAAAPAPPDHVPGHDVQDRAQWAATEPSCPLAASNRTAEIDDEGPTAATELRIVELYPNPVARGNVGEFFVVEVPPGTDVESLTVTDGYASATLPADLPAGRVAVSMDPNETRELTGYPVVELEGHLRLAADGDELALVTDEGVVDAVGYDRAPEAERWYRTDDGGGVGSIEGETVDQARGEWWPRRATCRPVSRSSVDEATAFVLPDSPEIPLETIASADDRIRLGGYTFTDDAVAAELERALERGVRVDVLLESGPVGGVPDGTRPLLDDLDAAGATIRLLGGEGSRYAYHHPKYAVVDDRVLVTTENWKPSGVGGASSRGWGVIVDDAELAADLAEVFDADAGGPDTTSWNEYRERATFVEEERAAGSFPSEVDPETVAVEEAELVLAPDNAENRLGALIESANESILLKQVRVGGPDFGLLEKTVEAARDGVDVRVLLDDSWYVADENRALADRLESTADREDLPLEVRLADDDRRFEKVHAKGLVIDEETVVVGSVNWNDHSLRENREVAIVLRGESVAEYYVTVFEADWEGGGGWTLPLELLLAILFGLALAALAGRKYVRVGPDSRGVPHVGGQRPVTIEPAGDDRIDAPDDADGRTDEDESAASTARTERT